MCKRQVIPGGLQALEGDSSKDQSKIPSPVISRTGGKAGFDVLEIIGD